MRRKRAIGTGRWGAAVAAAVLATGIWAGGPARAQSVIEARMDVTREAVRDTSPLPAVLQVDGKRREGRLVGRTETALVVLQTVNGTERKVVIPLQAVQAAFFTLEYDHSAVQAAEIHRQWATAANVLHRALFPAFAYLDLPDNNAVEPVAALGELLMRAAADARAAARTDEARAAAWKATESAARVLQLVARVAWYEDAPLAAVRCVRCLQDAGQEERARALLAGLPEPMVGESGYGLYWLLRAQTALATNDVDGAMHAAVNAVVFEDKDVETFPDALLVTGVCYDRLDSPYRARDVYLEVASIFPGTAWATEARTRLRALLDSGRTDAKEALPVENIFFGTQEDLNAKARALLETEPGNP